jgi:hypothetical protein
MAGEKGGGTQQNRLKGHYLQQLESCHKQARSESDGRASMAVIKTEVGNANERNIQATVEHELDSDSDGMDARSNIGGGFLKNPRQNV